MQVTGEQLCRKWSENAKWETETKKIKLLKRVCPLFLTLAEDVRLHLRQPSDKDVEPVLEHAGAPDTQPSLASKRVEESRVVLRTTHDGP